MEEKKSLILKKAEELGFELNDGERSFRDIVLNRSFAKIFFGQQLELFDDFEVVNIRDRAFEERSIKVHKPAYQFHLQEMVIKETQKELVDYLYRYYCEHYC